MHAIRAGGWLYELSDDGRVTAALGDAARWRFDGPTAVLNISGRATVPHLSVFTADRGLVLEGEAEGVRLRCRVEPTGEGILWRADLRNDGPLTVDALTLPRLRITDPPAEWRCTIPYSTGWKTGEKQLPVGRAIHARYPLPLGMQWVDIYTSHAGLYCAWQDQHACLKTLSVSRASRFVEISWTLEGLQVRPGQTYRAPEMLLAAHEGDWRTGAAWYRRWAESALAKPECPEWFRNDPNWTWLGMKGQHADRAGRTFADVPAEAQAAASVGVKTIQLASYFEHGHDTDYPFFRAGDSLGGEGGLIEAVRAIHDAGGRIALYTNGRLFDPAGPLALMHPEWRTWAVRREKPADERVPGDHEGLMQPDRYGSVTFAVMCPRAAGWRKLIAERVWNVVHRYGVDGVYVDQVCCADSFPCADPSHGHDRPGEAWGGYVELTRRIRERVKEENPSAYIASEGVCDVLGQHFDVLQAHNDWAGPVGSLGVPMPALFRTCFPDRVLVAGPTYEQPEHLLNIAHALLCGYDCVHLTRETLGRPHTRKVAGVLSWRRAFADAICSPRGVSAADCSCENVCAVCAAGRGRTVVAAGWVSWPPEDPPEPPETLRLTVAVETAGPVALHRPGLEPVRIKAEHNRGLVSCEVPFSPMFALTIEHTGGR